MNIPFNKPYMTGNEIKYFQEAYAHGWLSAGGKFTKDTCAWLEEHLHCSKALLTHSGTAALEMIAILADIKPLDEIIMPSYTFVSTANAFVLRGGTPVFVDIREDTMNIDETKIEEAITPTTKAIVVVHYAGVGCEMDKIMAIAKEHNIMVIEDAAHGIMAHYKGRPLGSIGHFAALSFHETKNIISGEGGALLVNEEQYVQRAEIVLEKGTDRRKFEQGVVNKYSWKDIGSSYQPGELVAAFLMAQLEEAEGITQRRLAIWQKYHDAFTDLEASGVVRRPIIPGDCQHNAHMYYLILPNAVKRTVFINHLKEKGILSVFHYVPLHESEAGQKYGRIAGNLDVTNDLSGRVVRLPMWLGLEDVQDYVIEEVKTQVAQLVPSNPA